MGSATWFTSGRPQACTWPRGSLALTAARWIAARVRLYLDDRGVAGLPARLDFPSWDLVDIYEGGGLPSSASLDPIGIGFINFACDVDVRAASTAYFVLAGAAQSPAAVRVPDQADGRLPPNMQVFSRSN